MKIIEYPNVQYLYTFSIQFLHFIVLSIVSNSTFILSIISYMSLPMTNAKTT